MYKKIYILLFLLLVFIVPVDVFAITKMQCNYVGNLPGYDEGIKVSVTIKLDGSTGGNAVFSSYVQLAEDLSEGTDIESCKIGGDYNKCMLELWTLIQGSPEAGKNYVEANNLKISFGIHENNSGNDIVNILTTNSNGNYTLLNENKEDYFVENNKYSCPDSLVALAKFNSGGVASRNFSFYIDKNGFDASKCNDHSTVLIEDYVCSNSSTFTKYENSSFPTIETEYDGGTISGGYNNCCVYMGKGGASPIYVYSFSNMPGNTTYATCLGYRCMTTQPTLNQVINDSSWNRYHNLSDCSKMPEKIFFTNHGNVYERTLDPSITCQAPTDSTDVFGDNNGIMFFITKSAAVSSLTTNGDNNDNSDNDNSSGIGDGNIVWGDPVDVNCDGIIGKEMLDFINKIFRWIQIIAPIFVIIMGSVEFAGAILQDDKDALKKAYTKLIKRLIIAVALFLIPLILTFVLNVFNEISGNFVSTCGIGE